MADAKTTPILPPAFRRESDGCSCVPDHHYRICCERHDWAYRGRDEARRGYWHRLFADENLRDCMRRANTAWVKDQLSATPTVRQTFRACAAYLLCWSWRPWVWWVALRLFGWIPYRRSS